MASSLLEPDFLPTSRPPPPPPHPLRGYKDLLPLAAPAPIICSSAKLQPAARYKTFLFCWQPSCQRDLYYPSPSFAMTSNFLCKSLNSCATKILTFFLREASSGNKMNFVTVVRHSDTSVEVPISPPESFFSSSDLKLKM